MPTLDDVRQLTARSRLLVQRNRAYLRRLEDELAQTRCVIERATAAYTVSDGLLRKIDGFALEAPDHKTMPVNEPSIHRLRTSDPFGRADFRIRDWLSASGRHRIT